MSSEETPLLEEQQDVAVKQHNAVYDRFSPVQKRTIVFLVAMAGLSPLLISESFIPSIPQIARDLHTTGAVVNFAIGLSIFTTAIASLFWANYSGFYGRRPIYLISLTIQCIGSFGVASAQDVPQLLAWRVVQALGASSGHSVGMGVISDIYRVEERGTASGIYFAAILLGPVAAPLIGGLVAHYWSWRAMQYALFGFALVSLVLTIFLQPETSQPGARGIDSVLASGGKASWVWLNPFKSLGLLRSPNVLLLALAGGLALLSDLFILVPIAFTIGAKYDITNEALIGALCIPIGTGNFIGAPLAGAISDRLVIQYRKQRGRWVPEDRLRATIPGALVMVPVSVLLCGITTRFVDGHLGLGLNCIWLFMNGLGVDFILCPSSAYNVDILHNRSAEVTAANSAVRALMMALSVTTILPLINTFGIFPVYSTIAVIAWVGYGFIWSIIRYGERMRAYVDLGFSTEASN